MVLSLFQSVPTENPVPKNRADYGRRCPGSVTDKTVADGWFILTAPMRRMAAHGEGLPQVIQLGKLSSNALVRVMQPADCRECSDSTDRLHRPGVGRTLSQREM